MDNIRKLKRKQTSLENEVHLFSKFTALVERNDFSRLFVCEGHSSAFANFQCQLIQNDLISETNIEHTKLLKARDKNQKFGS